MKSNERFYAADADDSSGAVASLAALAQPTRLALFRLLLEHEPAGLTPGAIAAKLGLAPATLSFHLKELAGAGLVKARQEGRFIYYAPDFGATHALVAYLTENCCSGACKENCA